MIDNDLPPRLAKALHTIFEDDGDQIVSLRAKFGRDSLKDEEWIPVLGTEKNWVVISADTRIAKKRPSRQLFLQNRLTGFFFNPALQKSPLNKQTARLLILWPRIKEQDRLVTSGCFGVPMTGQKFASIGR